MRLSSALFVACIAGVSAITPNPAIGKWVDSWVSMPQLTEPANLPPAPFNTTGLVFPNTTLRQTLRMTLSSSQLRIRISNAFSPTDLTITAASIALPPNNTAGSDLIIPNTLQKLTFSGSSSITIPGGALAVSDPINFLVKPTDMVSVSLFLENGQTGNSITSHPGSRTTTWMTFGDHHEATTFTDPSTTSVAHWYFLSAVESWSPPNTRAMAIVGDSITDGRGSTTDGNDRWTDDLLTRVLGQSTRSRGAIALLNQAAGGNRILNDGLGPNAVSRIDRDVLSQPGVSYVMIFEGVNDIGTAAATNSSQQAVGDRLIQAFQQIITRVHAVGLPIFGATITPFSGDPTIQPYSDPIREAQRQRINNWIRTSGKFDGVVDFDAAIRDPSNPAQLAPQFDSGDFLHPNPAGYRKLAAQFDLSLFDRFANGVSGFE
ncbi:hypothetical protein QCA50_011194 [Cerrena zonata]|uniref:SGNH hydrolase-type esterase domain-containing protein n=1 Tax=Cerrena zonata TaxID=2478898 RepID=A0AAW0G784_9APHY